jgi:hypothetical protein
VGPQPKVHGGALLTYHLLPELAAHQLATEPLRLYPPAHHLKKIQELYAALGLKRVFLGINSNEPASKTPHPGCTRSLTLESRFLVDEFPITPSSLTSPFANREALLRELFSSARDGFSQAEKHLLQISLNDQRTPELCQALEQEGYSFVGILPMCCGTDYILYSRFERSELESMPPLSITADALRTYMLEPR